MSIVEEFSLYSKQTIHVICGNSMNINVIIRSFCFMVNSIIFKFAMPYQNSQNWALDTYKLVTLHTLHYFFSLPLPLLLDSVWKMCAHKNRSIFISVICVHFELVSIVNRFERHYLIVKYIFFFLHVCFAISRANFRAWFYALSFHS